MRVTLPSVTRLDGERALITGATSGIGWAIADAFVREGASVILAARDAGRGNAVAAEMGRRGGSVHFVQADLSSTAGARQLADESLALLGDVGILVNNAALMAYAPTDQLDEDTWDAMIATNMKAPFFLVARLGPLMAARGRGKIVNITTVAAHVASPEGAAYGATKAGLELMTKAWAKEFGAYGVNVNAIAPGAIKTGWSERVARDQVDAFCRVAVAGRLGLPGEIADAAVFLSSHEADFIHGTTLHVDGGWTSVPGDWPSLRPRE